ncbi:MAG: acyl-CoA dehydrogenase family protein [Pseudomonadota bacterium]|nr:acyl-CoA dehydrogenase family protein [Pseudomonadota bacterium]MED5365482.1 acyl-CoA dehydrogenase family protein [Pseudomonadota bacterium]
MAATVDTVIWKVRQGERCIPENAMLKNQLTKDHEWGAGQAVQMFGGAGIIRGHPVERIFRESNIEVMKDLAAKQLGF